MYCENCGNQLSEKALFCEQCGAKVEATEYESMAQNKKISGFSRICEQIKSNKRLQKMLACIGGLFVLLIAIICILVNAANTIKLTDYITVEEISGINGYATVDYAFDWDSLYVDVFGEAPLDSDSFEGFAQSIQYEEKCSSLRDCIDIKIDGNNAFSNGDTAEIVITVDLSSIGTKINKKIKGGSHKEKISGLEEGKTIDIFGEEYLSLSVEGVNGFGVASIEKTFDNKWQYGITYEIEKSEGLSNGDMVRVIATFDDSSYDSYVIELAKEGYALPNGGAKEFKVDGLLELAQASHIDSSFVEKAESAALKYMKQEMDDFDSLTDVKIVCVYFNDKNDKTEPYKNFWNGITLYNSINVIVAYNEGTIERTWNIIFTDIVLQDGVPVLSEANDDGFETFRCTAEEALEAFFDDRDNYTITRLK